MIKNNLLGRFYPFFLDNKFGIGNVHYLYQIVSPSYNKKTCVPYFSLSKVSEGNRFSMPSLPLGCDEDILLICKNGMDSIRRNEKVDRSCFDKVKFIYENFFEDKSKDSVKIVDEKPESFPYIELSSEPGNELQKSLIVGIRSYLRWKNYRYFVGKKVDILMTKDEFMITDVMEDDTFIWLEPVSLFKTKDIMMTTPLDMSKVNVDGIKNNLKWKKEEFKPNELIKVLNKIEYRSFEYSSFV